MSSGSPVALPGVHTPGAGFDQPFEMLAACHERVQRSLGLLQRLASHVGLHGADAQARDAAADVLRYFDQAAPAHHEDEERHLVPRLAASADVQARDAARQLLDDHAEIRRRWSRLAPLLQAVQAGDAPPCLQDAADAFAEIHAAHLRLEDTLVFPSAHAVLQAEGAAALAAMGEEMASRRRR